MEDLDKVKAYYDIIIKSKLGDDPLSVQKRVDIIRYLEKTLKTEFRNTEDFNKKIQAYIWNKEKSGGTQLREIRNRKGWSQQLFADVLGISRKRFNQMEQNKVSLNPKALKFVQEFKKSEEKPHLTTSGFLRRKVTKLEEDV